MKYCKKIFFATITLIVIVSLTCFFFGCEKNNNDFYYRSVYANDIIVQEKSNSSFYSMCFFVRPQEDILNLFIYFAFFDSNDNPIIGKSKELGEVNKGSEYTIEIDLSQDLSLLQFSSIKKYKIDFLRGSVKEKQNVSGLCFSHEFNEGVVTRQPSCHLSGEKVFTCSNCNYKKVEILACEEHSYIVWQVIEEPTCISSGKYWYICKNCAVREQRYVAPTLICSDKNNDGRCDFCGNVI